MDQNPSKEPMTQCLVCGKRFSTPSALKRHLKRHAEKAYKCDICDKAFVRKDELKSHLSTHAEVPFHVCENCGMCLPSRASLYNHKVIVHNLKKIECDICEKTFVTKQNMMRHRKSHGENATEKCPSCDKYFTRLKDHLSKCKKDRSRKFKCNCGKKFLENKYLQEHIKYKHGNERYQCPKCSHVFAHRKSFIIHKKKC